jgi:hypothetical protein
VSCDFCGQLYPFTREADEPVREEKLVSLECKVRN